MNPLSIGVGIPMDIAPPNFLDILSGILLLAANDGECLPVRNIHSIFHEMKSHETILSGLRFSLTGAVCYSRNVDSAIQHLVELGLLRIAGDSAVVCGDIPEFRSHLERSLTNPQIRAIHSASLRFYDRMRRSIRGLGNINASNGRSRGKAGLP